MQSIASALLNTILVSIPEEMFLAVMTLIFLKRFDMLDLKMWKYNLRLILIPVIPTALVINILRYLIFVPKPIIMLISILSLYILITYITKSNNYLKTMIYLTLSIVIWGTLENITCPVLLFLIEKPLDLFLSNVLWNFVLSIPSRVIGYVIIIYIIIKNNNPINVRLFDIIVKQKLYSRILLFLTISFNVVSVYIIKLITCNKILEGKITLIGKIIISELILVFPVIIIFLMVLLINDLICKERSIRQTYENLVIQDDIMFDVDDQ